jgi:hypothetical protein
MKIQIRIWDNDADPTRSVSTTLPRRKMEHPDPDPEK